MILGFKTKFDDGQETFFKQKIAAGLLDNWDSILIPDGQISLAQSFSLQYPTANDGLIDPKIHSIRGGHRWRSGMIIHMATGVRTKKYECFCKLICFSVQDVKIVFELGEIGNIIVDNNRLSKDDQERIIRNDGLTRDQFTDWFYSVSEFDHEFRRMVYSGQIVHWTDLKY